MWVCRWKLVSVCDAMDFDQFSENISNNKPMKKKSVFIRTSWNSLNRLKFIKTSHPKFTKIQFRQIVLLESKFSYKNVFKFIWRVRLCGGLHQRYHVEYGRARIWSDVESKSECTVRSDSVNKRARDRERESETILETNRYFHLTEQCIVFYPLENGMIWFLWWLPLAFASHHILLCVQFQWFAENGGWMKCYSIQ